MKIMTQIDHMPKYIRLPFHSRTDSKNPFQCNMRLSLMSVEDQIESVLNSTGKEKWGNKGL